jgi:hypothetical protein
MPLAARVAVPLDRHELPWRKLYGPYLHAGRDYMQWMARGEYLRETLLPILERRLAPELDAKAFEAVQAMKTRYATKLGIEPQAPETRA